MDSIAGQPRASPEGIRESFWARPHARLFVLFALLALATRLVFWLYTGRVWEDSLIALTSARNLWEGHGLTHHASEPRVHSFTSVLGEWILIAGEAFREGLLVTRLASLVAAVVSIHFAYRIGLLLSFSRAAHVLVLGYLATDHLQIFFGMGGMETQFATAIILANAYYFLTARWTALGCALGLAMLARPEFYLWVVIVGATLLVWKREALVRVFLPTVLIWGPWAVFAQVYYGSIVPHTMVAKSTAFQRQPFAPLDRMWDLVLNWWSSIAPFRQYFAVRQAPVPEFVLKSVVVLLAALAAAGSWRAWKEERRLLAIVALVAGFALYRTVTAPGPYTMWYLPPFMALFVLIAGYGASLPGRARILAPIALFVAGSYAAHLPFTLPLDRQVQDEIEIGMLKRVGVTLDGMMTSTDTAALEPIGTIGWEARNKTLYDFPGLGSRASLEAVRRRPGTGLGNIVTELSPTFVVLRPPELEALKTNWADTAARYEEVAHITPEKPFRLYRWGLSYMKVDTDFTILKRKDAR